MAELNSDERKVLNHLQGGLPVEHQPFRKLESRIGLSESTIISTLNSLQEKNMLSRFGAVLNTRAMGGDSRLASIAVPDNELEKTIEIINEYRTVSHNYLRDHTLNLWFVLSADSSKAIDNTLYSIEDITGHKVFNFPKLKEYYVGLKFKFHKDGSVETVSFSENYTHNHNTFSPLNELQREVIHEIQDGIPIVRKPYEIISESLGRKTETILKILQELLKSRRIKRLGCVPNHYALGIRGNGMMVLDVPDDEVDSVGKRLGQRDEVTHCYRRPRYRPEWPYNLFAMVHDRTREQAREKARILRKELKLDFQHEILFSERLLKKTGLRLKR